jgi:hypothetical protein
MSAIDPETLGYDLLPPDPSIISPDLALEAALAPVVDLQPPEVLPYGKGWAFDFVANEFFMHGSSPAAAYDTDNLVVWIEKCLRTARFTYPIYSDDFGVSDPTLLIGGPLQPETVAQWEQDVVEALTTHDRILDVVNFVYRQADDVLNILFEVILDGSETEVLPITTQQQLAVS